MAITRPWAFWRRMQYGTLFSVLVLLVMYWGYSSFLYAAPTCFDDRQNSSERGVDCGGGCLLICAADTQDPIVRWSRSFEVTSGQYNAVAYVENVNQVAGTPRLHYVFSLYDGDGLIAERFGTTFLPPDGAYPIFEGRIFTGGRVPTQTFLELETVDVWLPVSVGRNQFSITSRQLLGADVRPRLNATISNNELTETGEVEVIATIFDARGNALTASQTVIDEFAPRSEENVVFTWPEPIAKTLRSCEIPTDVVIAIDLSGSMNNDGDTPPEPISSVLAAAEAFVSRLQSTDQAALVTFATDATSNVTITSPEVVSAAIASLGINPAEETGSTNTGDAFVRADEVFTGVGKNPDARKVMVVLTDGLATAPDEEPELYALQQAAALKATGVDVHAIGLGEQVNMDFIRQLASPGQGYQAISRNQVDRIYQQITSAICEDGAAVIDIVPKTNANFPNWQ